jgi:hypothetical protein
VVVAASPRVPGDGRRHAIASRVSRMARRPCAAAPRSLVGRRATCVRQRRRGFAAGALRLRACPAGGLMRRATSSRMGPGRVAMKSDDSRPSISSGSASSACSGVRPARRCSGARPAMRCSGERLSMNFCSSSSYPGISLSFSCFQLPPHPAARLSVLRCPRAPSNPVCPRPPPRAPPQGRGDARRVISRGNIAPHLDRAPVQTEGPRRRAQPALLAKGEGLRPARRDGFSSAP